MKKPLRYAGWTVAGHALTIPTDSLAGWRGLHRHPAGTFLYYAANLTRGRGGVGGQFTDLDWERAIRHGLKPDGSVLLFMPSQEFTMPTDQDAAGLIAYLKTLPPVDREPMKNRVGPLGRALHAKGDVALVPAALIDQTAPHVPAVPVGVTVEYGRYVAGLGGCTGCHGPDLSGGHIPGAPPDWKPAANITPTGIGYALRLHQEPDRRRDPRAVALPQDRAAQTFRHAIANCTVVIVDSRSFRSLTS